MARSSTFRTRLAFDTLEDRIALSTTSLFHPIELTQQNSAQVVQATSLGINNQGLLAVQQSSVIRQDAFQGLNWNSPTKFRGIMISAPNWSDPQLTEENIQEISSWGVNVVRWSMNPCCGHVNKRDGSGKYDLSKPEEYRAWIVQNELPVLQSVLPLFQRYGIGIILELHTPPGVNPDTWGTQAYDAEVAKVFDSTQHQNTFVKAWEDLASWGKDKPAIIAYDLLNEPNTRTPTRSARWTSLANQAIQAIRKIDMTKTVIIESVLGAYPQNLMQLPTVKDPANRVVYSIHVYPEVALANRNGVNGLQLNEVQMNSALQRIPSVLAQVRQWQVKNKARIFVGEFSAGKDVPKANDFVQKVVNQFEQYGWDWSYLGYQGDKVFDLEKNTARLDLLKGQTPRLGGYSLNTWKLDSADTIVAGTKSGDAIVVRDAPGTTLNFEVSVNGRIVRRGNWNDLSSLTIKARDGNDMIRVESTRYRNYPVRIIVEGGDGNDVLFGGVANDELFGGLGNDHIEAGAGEDIVRGDAGDDYLFGGDGDDVLWGGSSTDEWGADGNDRLEGGAGIDTLMGQAGNDVLSGGDNNDALYGGVGNDVLRGDAGDDLILGEWGDDELHGGDGSDGLIGNDGNDRLYGGLGGDYLYGNEGNDVILGDEGDDRIEGGPGNDALYGQGGTDRVLGQEGDDGVFGGEGDDWLEGNEGNDVVGYDILFGEPGDDTLQGGTGDDHLFGGDGNDVIWGGASSDAWGADGDDRMEGGFGNDTMIGQAGNDSMFGGSGNDELYGGYGNDYLDGQQDDDIVFGEWDDDEALGGPGNDWVKGDVGNDRLLGDDGDDLIQGDDGNDVMLGGDGNDTLHGGDGLDEIYGDQGDDRLDGGAGNDFMAGLTGNDLLYGDEGDDTIHGGDQDDSIFGGEGADSISGGQGDDTLKGENGADDLWGDEGNDTLVGGNDNDVLRGGDGDDLLIGTFGSDTFLGGTGNNTIIG